MRIAVVGAGAVGGVLGSLLLEAGEEVTLVDVNPQLIKAISEEGLTVIFPNGEEKRFAHVITDDPKSVGPVDLVIISVKSYHSESAARSALPLIGPSTLILSVQNGAGNVEAIASATGKPDQVLGGVFLSSVTPLSHTRLRYIYGMGGLKFGPYLAETGVKYKKIMETFSRTRLEVEFHETIQDVIWNKVMHNSINCMAAVLDIGNHEFISYPSGREIFNLLTNEVVDVMRAKGIALENEHDPVRPVLNVMENFRAAGDVGSRASMLQDLKAGRKTEVDAINGMVASEGKSLNVPTPVNSLFVLLIKALEEKAVGRT